MFLEMLILWWPLQIQCEMKYPQQWNDLYKWRFSLSFNVPKASQIAAFLCASTLNRLRMVPESSV
jgi:hypothetical protein